MPPVVIEPLSETVVWWGCVDVVGFLTDSYSILVQAR